MSTDPHRVALVRLGMDMSTLVSEHGEGVWPHTLRGSMNEAQLDEAFRALADIGPSSRERWCLTYCVSERAGESAQERGGAVAQIDVRIRKLQ